MENTYSRRKNMHNVALQESADLPTPLSMQLLTELHITTGMRSRKKPRREKLARSYSVAKVC